MIWFYSPDGIAFVYINTSRASATTYLLSSLPTSFFPSLFLPSLLNILSGLEIIGQIISHMYSKFTCGFLNLNKCQAPYNALLHLPVCTPTSAGPPLHYTTEPRWPPSCFFKALLTFLHQSFCFCGHRCLNDVPPVTGWRGLWLPSGIYGHFSS